MKNQFKFCFLIFFSLLLVAKASGVFTMLVTDWEKYSFLTMDCTENETSEQESEKECKDVYENDTEFFHSAISFLLIGGSSLNLYKTSENIKPQVYLSCPFLPPEQFIS